MLDRIHNIFASFAKMGKFSDISLLSIQRASAIILVVMTLSCENLSTEEEIAPIIFEGIKEVTKADNGDLIIRWDQATGVPIEGYEVYLQDLSFVGTGLNLAETTGEATGVEEDSITSVLVQLPEEESPSKNGNLLTVVEGSLNSHQLESLVPGKYAFQVKAVAIDGRTDDSENIILMTIDSAPIYPGIEAATLQGTVAKLSWGPLKTALKGQVNYTVYDGRAFDDPIHITSELSYDLELRGRVPGTEVDIGVRATDAKGRQDKNGKFLTLIVPEENGKYEGCVTAEPRGSDRILVSFGWPEAEYDKFSLLRNGVDIFISKDRGILEYLDIGLQEGETYEYICKVHYKDLVRTGTNVVKAATLASNAPRFGGLKKVTITGASTAELEWGVTSGVPNEIFKIYANPGKEVDFSLEPIATALPSELKTEVTGLGDDIQYAFGVRSCSLQNDCDTNLVSVTATTLDSGAPTTVGATAVEIKDGKFIVTAPWEASQGGVAVRYLKVHKQLLPTEDGYTQGLTKEKEFPADGNGLIPAELVFETKIVNKTTYYIEVVDKDPQGQSTAGNTPISIESGDNDAPEFKNNLITLAKGLTGKEQTDIIVSFRALAWEEDPLLEGIEADDARDFGASDYLVLLREGEADACADSATLYATLKAADFRTKNQVYTTTITGLAPQTQYSVCIKAKDLTGNISEENRFLTKWTLDTVKPVFDGLNVIPTDSFDRESGKQPLTWNPQSETSDVIEYKIKYWTNNSDEFSADPPPVITTILAEEAASGFELQLLEYGVENNIKSNDDVYITVSACDDAGLVPEGTQNCSDFHNPEIVEMDDIEPPVDFPGIKLGSSDHQYPDGNSITVNWHDPSDWNDIGGFKVYFIDMETNEIDTTKAAIDVPKSGTGPTFVNVTGLDAARTYRFHVRAYDINTPAANYTLLSITDFSADLTTSDTEAPTFPASLTEPVREDDNVRLTWGSASDNQYVPADNPESVYITYELYRKTINQTHADYGSCWTGSSESDNYISDADIANTSSLGSCVTLIYEGIDLEYLDVPPRSDDGVLYQYLACARDMAGNRLCLGESTRKSFLIPDRDPPEITCFKTNKGGTSCDNDSDNALEDDADSWKLDWVATDLTTATSDLKSSLYIKYSTEPDTYVGSKTGEYDAKIMDRQINTFLNTDLEGPADTDTYIHYLLVVEDADQNKAEARVSLYSQNKVSISSVAPREVDGTIGGVMIIVRGDGFRETPLPTVKISGASCLNVKVYSKRILSCTVPNSTTYGTGVVEVVNDNGSSGIAPDAADGGPAFKYCNKASNVSSSTYCSNTCNRPGDWGSNFAAGDGTVADPYLICNADHLDYIRNTGFVNWNLGRSYALGANIEIDSSFQPLKITSGNFFLGNFDGQGHAIIGFSYDSSSVDRVGFFRVIRKPSSVVNLGLLDFDVTARHNIGGLVGISGGHHHGQDGEYGSSDVTIDNIYLQGSVTGVDRVGGLSGDGYSGATNVESDVVVNGRTFVGGVFGYGWRSVGGSKSFGTVVATSSNSQCYAGGISGYQHAFWGTQSNLYSEAKVTCSANALRTGGFFGDFTHGVVKNSTSKAEVVSQGSHTGGLIGHCWRCSQQIAPGVFAENFFFGSVSGLDNVGGHIGALAENADSEAEDTWGKRLFNYGAVSGRQNVGGILGYAHPDRYGDSENEFSELYNYGEVKGTTENVGGLFGQIARLKIDKAYNYVSMDNDVNRMGGIVGRCYQSQISNSINQGDISSASGNYIGGVMGAGQSNNRGCSLDFVSSTGDVTGKDYVGGLVGQLWGDVSNSMASGKVIGQDDTGGLIGKIYVNTGQAEALYDIEISNSFATGDVAARNRVGGLIGNIDRRTKVEKSYSTGSVEAEADIGGLIGRATFENITVRQSYSSSEVIGAVNVGGLIGNAGYDATNAIEYSDLYASGDVQGGENTGGLFGHLRDGETLSNSFSTGGVGLTPGNAPTNVNGLIGLVGLGNGQQVTGAFWSKELSGQAASPAGVFLTSEGMKGGSAYGLYSPEIWSFDNSRYPILKFQE